MGYLTTLNILKHDCNNQICRNIEVVFPCDTYYVTTNIAGRSLKDFSQIMQKTEIQTTVFLWYFYSIKSGCVDWDSRVVSTIFLFQDSSFIPMQSH